MSEKNLPLKVVPPLEQDFYKPEYGGGPKKTFVPVTPEFREMLSSQVISIRDHFQTAFRIHPRVPAVAKVKMRPDAAAKSHRPNKILSASTCPIIGVEGLGELLLSVTSSGLENLARRIENDQTKEAIANMSTFALFQPYRPSIEVPEDRVAKVKLFRHGISNANDLVDQSFFAILENLRIRNAQEIEYGRGLKIFKIELDGSGLISALENYVGLQSLGPFPVYHPVRTASVPVRDAKADDLPAPVDGVDYPVVGVIDSGTNKSDPQISPWRVAREVYVPSGYQDTTHGSFVSGIIINGKALNHGDDTFPSCSSKIIDVVALEKGGTTEDNLLTRIEDALDKFRDVKIWNLSLGKGVTVSNSGFSDFGVALDRLQDDFGVTFVLAAGNYPIAPYRGWPPEDLGESDRVCAPADSVRSIVVGASAHRDHRSSRVKTGEPSPFSRRGPGPLYLPKPELVHVGGNCSNTGDYSQIGVLSLDGKGKLVEDVGTSFATPSISNLLANVDQRVIGGTSSLLSRAILVHSAAMRSGKIDPQILRYQGFGMPPDIDDLLKCEPWQSTLIFELLIPSGVAFEKAVFPMPPSLFQSSDVLRANILMTLVHNCDLDASFGSEYCRSNLEVSMGTYDLGTNGKQHQKKQVPEDPRLVGAGYEKDLVEYGFKWSPVKVYRREMTRGVKGKVWRLDLAVHHRSGHAPKRDERAALIITISDPLKKAPVYDEMVVQMNNFGWSANDLQVRSRLRT